MALVHAEGKTLVQVSEKSILRVFEINKPYGYAAITTDPVTHEYQYEVVEPTLTEEERGHLQRIRGFLVETLDVMMSELGSREEAEEYLEGRVREIVRNYRLKVGEHSLNKILYYITRDYIGYGRIDVMMRDPLIEDISCNGVNIPVYIWHRDYESVPSNVFFPSEEALDSFIIRLAYRTGRMISIARPMLDAILPDGSRIQMTLGTEVTRHGSTFTIRKFKADPLTIIDIINFGTLSSEMAAVFWYVIENKNNVFVCGPTATGKTTMINCLSSFILPDAKIVTIEDTPEIQLYHKNWIRSVARPATGSTAEINLFDLLRAAMRQRPDYVIVGEVRGEEAYTLFQAMATGHGGISTIHAESIEGAIHRLETKPMDIPRNLITNLNVVVILARYGMRRRAITTTEIVGIDPRTDEIITNETFRWDAKTDSYTYSGRSYLLEGIARRKGVRLREIMQEIDRRRTILEWMRENKIRSFKDVTEVIRSFYANPEEVLKAARVGA
ncbi:MAG: type II/IV secretion system ATPase subunit [Candidatus Bathyarchaeia archaeon]